MNQHIIMYNVYINNNNTIKGEVNNVFNIVLKIKHVSYKTRLERKNNLKMFWVARLCIPSDPCNDNVNITNVLQLPPRPLLQSPIVYFFLGDGNVNKTGCDYMYIIYTQRKRRSMATAAWITV